jgi:hypothetical protein
MGNREAAAGAYTDALLGATNGSVNSDFVQLKLNDVFQAEAAEVSGDIESSGDIDASGAPDAGSVE